MDYDGLVVEYNGKNHFIQLGDTREVFPYVPFCGAMGRRMVQGESDLLSGRSADILSYGCPRMPEVVDADRWQSVVSTVCLQCPVDVDVEAIQILMPEMETEKILIV